MLRQPIGRTGRTATLVVAASDALDQSKAQADYVCDGTDDDVQIQAAIDALPVAGGEIVLSEGTFHIESTIAIVDRFWITIQGQGIATSLRGYLNADIMQVTGTGGGYTSGITLFKDMVFVYHAGFTHTDTALFLGNFTAHVWAINCWFEDAQRGIETSGTDYVTLINCMGEGNIDTLFLLDSQYVDVLVCRSWDGAAGSNGSITVQTSTDVRIIGGSYQTGTLHGIHLIGASRCTVNGVDINTFARNGILLDTSSDNNIIEGNVVWNNATGAIADGIRLDDSDLNLVQGNRCYDTAGGAGTQRYGIVITGTSTGNTVQGNVLTGNETAALLDISVPADTVIRNNVGWITESSGTGSITNGGTSDVIAHGLDVTPTVADISITLAENPTNTPGAIWVDTIGAANFTVNCENDPGASNLDFGWCAQVW